MFMPPRSVPDDTEICVSHVLARAKEVIDYMALRLIRYRYAIEQHLCHARLKFLAEGPLAGAGVGCCWADAVFALAIFILIVGKVQRFFPGIVQVISDAYASAFSFGLGGDHDHAVFGTRAVERRRCCAFQHGHAFYIVGVYTLQAVATV